jgi:hypothetical protein
MKRLLALIPLKRIVLILGVAVIVAIGIYSIRVKNELRARNEKCLASIRDQLEQGMTPGGIYSREFEVLQTLVEYSLVARAEMLKIAAGLREKEDEPLSSRDLLTLREGAESYLDVREKLYALAEEFECAIDVDDEALAKWSIDPELKTKAVMLSLSAALTLYDNYLVGAVVFEDDSRLRNIVNDPDMGFGLVANKLFEMAESATSVVSRYRIRKAIKFYEEKKDGIPLSDEDSDFSYLVQLIESSPSYNFIKKVRVGEIASRKLQMYGELGIDDINAVKDGGFDFVSGLFGNAVGLYESRKGKLYHDKEVKRKIQAVLKPLDILLEKTPFRLTDKLIPGYFGHVAIWLGTKQELVDSGVWSDRVIAQYHDDISTDADPNSKDQHQIVEALRSGVQLSTLEEFLNVDDVAILRPVFPDGSKAKLTREALVLAFRQVGKKYDFNFDVNTTDKIVCSELAFVSFPSVDWPTEKTLGRYTISPDNIAEKAWNNYPLQLVLFYHEGNLVAPEGQVALMRELMKP